MSVSLAKSVRPVSLEKIDRLALVLTTGDGTHRNGVDMYRMLRADGAIVYLTITHGLRVSAAVYAGHRVQGKTYAGNLLGEITLSDKIPHAGLKAIGCARAIGGGAF